MAVRAARLAASSLRVLPRKRLSRALGRIADLHGAPPLLGRVIRTFVNVYGVDLGEAVIPEGGFTTFDAFFTRRLLPGARPPDPDPKAVLSPADGRLEDLGPITQGATLRVKGRRYSVGELLGDPGEATRYEGGAFFIIYLSPRDYHRVHAPAGGGVARVRHVPGTLFPVNAIGLDHIDNLFARNERVAVVQETEGHGVVTTVLVGAMGVGRIGLAFDDLRTNGGREHGVRDYGRDAPRIGRGEELGVFHLGSTVIVFLEPGVGMRFERAPGDVVRVGQAVGRTGGTP
jgi:phosphatidylserine decarboxylase